MPFESITTGEPWLRLPELDDSANTIEQRSLIETWWAKMRRFRPVGESWRVDKEMLSAVHPLLHFSGLCRRHVDLQVISCRLTYANHFEPGP